MYFCCAVSQAQQKYTPAELASLAAYAQSYNSVFVVLYSVEFLCLSMVKLTVLDRMQDFCAPQDDLRRRERWVKASRAVMVLVVVGGVVGISGNIVSAVYKLQSADFATSAASAADKGNVFEVISLIQQCTDRGDLAVKIESIQGFSEISVLVLLIATFIAVGVMCARRVDSSLASMTSGAGATAKHLRRQIVVTVAVVFVTFFLRATYTTMLAISSAFQNGRHLCSHVCSLEEEVDTCPHPYNMYTLMYLYLTYSPEFQIVVVLISSPLALLVALWGMTSDHTLEAMRRNKKQSQTMRSRMLQGEA